MNVNQDDDLYLSEQHRLAAAAGARALDSLRNGHPFSILLAEEEEDRTNALNTLLSTLASPTTRIARATNPLRAPLTLERLLIQLVPDGVDILDQSPATVVRHIAIPQAAETLIILVIERAETLHPELLRFLGQASDHFADVSPRLQVLFTGRPSFQELLAHPDSGFDHRTVLLDHDEPGEPEPLPVAPSPQPTPSPYLLLSPSTIPILQPAAPIADPAPPPQPHGIAAEFAAMWRQSVLNRLVLLLGPLIAIAAIATGISVAIHPPVETVQPEPVTTLADRPAPGQANPSLPEPRQPREEASAELKREFEAYLAASGRNIDRLPPNQTRAAYDEFLSLRARTQSTR